MTNSEEKNTYAEQPSKLLSKEKTELLEKYFEAMAHFYYIIPLKKVYDIINGEYGEDYPEDAFLEFAEAVPSNERLHCDLVGEDLDDDSKTPIFERNLVHEAMFVDCDVYYELLNCKKGKNDYYILPKEELLKYADDLYESANLQYRTMRSFVARYENISAKDAEDRIAELMFNIRDGISSPLTVVKKISGYSDIHVYAAHYDEFEPMYIDLYNNTRNPHLNGYTPEEYMKMTGDPDKSMYSVLEDISEEKIFSELREAIDNCEYHEYQMREFRRSLNMQTEQKQQPLKKVKIGRNDPCPCGSGKKYKKCCGADL